MSDPELGVACCVISLFIVYTLAGFCCMAGDRAGKRRDDADHRPPEV